MATGGENASGDKQSHRILVSLTGLSPQPQALRKRRGWLSGPGIFWHTRQPKARKRDAEYE